jgi:hypothetical protein
MNKPCAGAYPGFECTRDAHEEGPCALVKEKVERKHNGLFLMGVCFINSALLTINFRAVAQARYFETAITDFLIFLFGYLVVKRIVESKRLIDGILYALGGTVGSLVMIYFTKLWWNQ